MQLLRDPSVRFSGYMVPHPLIHKLDLKIQTNSSTISPVEVLSAAIEDLSNEADHLNTQTFEAIDKWKYCPQLLKIYQMKPIILTLRHL